MFYHTVPRIVLKRLVKGYDSFYKVVLVGIADSAMVKYNLCNPFKHDLRCASLCGVEFVFPKERRGKEGAAEVMFERVTEIRTWAHCVVEIGKSAKNRLMLNLLYFIISKLNDKRNLNCSL